MQYSPQIGTNVLLSQHIFLPLLVFSEAFDYLSLSVSVSVSPGVCVFTQELLQIALKENKQLAKEYESMKKSLMKAKQEEVSAQIKRNSQHGSFLYYKQVTCLHINKPQFKKSKGEVQQKIKSKPSFVISVFNS